MRTKESMETLLKGIKALTLVIESLKEAMQLNAIRLLSISYDNRGGTTIQINAGVDEIAKVTAQNLQYVDKNCDAEKYKRVSVDVFGLEIVELQIIEEDVHDDL